MLKDTAVLADAEKLGLDVYPMGGEELQALVAKLYGTPSNVVERAKQSLVYRGPAK